MTDDSLFLFVSLKRGLFNLSSNAIGQMKTVANFKQVLQDKENALPETKRPKPVSRPIPDDPMSKAYLTEAYNILNYVNTLNRMLASVRRPYLDVNSRVAHHTSSRTFTLDSSEAWANSRQLTNEERDQIDLQARTILSRCSEKVKEMEALEKRRIKLVASRTNPLTRLLPIALRQDDSTLSSDVVAAHHASITWYLSRRLAEASQSQKDMQEERVKRQLERTRTLGSGATREALSMGTPVVRSSSKGSWIENASSSLLAVTLGTHPPPDQPETSINHALSDDEDDDIELSESQILQFEKENSDLLQSVQETLESVQQAEARLMEISTLQMELISHLTQQTELTDQLYEDAIATTSMVEKGNAQLREARRRSKDSRLFILLFLIGASLSLLFLHYY